VIHPMSAKHQDQRRSGYGIVPQALLRLGHGHTTPAGLRGAQVRVTMSAGEITPPILS
jgi:hypothetical protein